MSERFKTYDGCLVDTVDMVEWDAVANGRVYRKHTGRCVTRLLGLAAHQRLVFNRAVRVRHMVWSTECGIAVLIVYAHKASGGRFCVGAGPPSLLEEACRREGGSRLYLVGRRWGCPPGYETHAVTGWCRKTLRGGEP